MLHEFLKEERAYIIEKCEDETIALFGTKEISPAIRFGWATVFDQLTELLQLKEITFDLVRGKGRLSTDQKVEQKKREDASKKNSESIMRSSAEKQGGEYRRLGFTLSDVVHSYGIVCQAITSAANELSYVITSSEFSQLNLSLDVAIALAVTEYERMQIEQGTHSEIERIGSLAHELRNSLQNAFMALELVESGDVGTKAIQEKSSIVVCRA